MPLFGSGKRKPSRQKQLKGAFSIQLNPTVRDRAAEAREAAQDKAIRVLAREAKKEAERQALVDRAEALKEKALRRREQEQERVRREADRRRRQEKAEERTACTCRRPTLGRDGKCVRCHKKPHARRR